MDKEIIIDKGRENDELTEFSKRLYNHVDNYIDAHIGTNAMVLISNNEGVSDFLIGDPKAIAKDLMEVAVRHEGFLEVISTILKELKKI